MLVVGAFHAPYCKVYFRITSRRAGRLTNNMQNTTRRPRLLMMAYCCSPYHGSEPGVGWNFAVQAARHCDTWVICEQHKFMPHIRRYLDAHGEVPGLRFVFVPERAWAAAAWRIPGMGYLSYNLWQRRALRAARRLHAQVRFDLVHHVNILGFREPGYLWKLGVPFIWGPVGGTQNYPLRFLGEAGPRGALAEAARTVANQIQLRISRRVRRASREAAVMMAANSTVQHDFARIHGITPNLMSDIGVTEITGSPRSYTAKPDCLKILWCGALEPWKALSLLIKALARLPEGVRYELRVVGDGPMRSRYQRLARRLGVDRHTTWLGSMPHSEVVRQYDWADVFAFTSLRDTTGTVVLESLGAALPVICLDHQGAHDMVTEQCGVKIPVTTPGEVVRRLSETITSLADDPDRLELLSRGAFERAHEYLWSRRGERIAEIYRQVLSEQFTGEPEEEFSYA